MSVILQATDGYVKKRAQWRLEKPLTIQTEEGRPAKGQEEVQSCRNGSSHQSGWLNRKPTGKSEFTGHDDTNCAKRNDPLP